MSHNSFSPRLRFVVALFAMAVPGPLAAHEFWIDPVSHTIGAGDEIVASLRVGQQYDGETYPYLSPRFEKFTVTDPTGTRDYTGNQGDEPALETSPEVSGLHVITYVSRPNTLRYKDWDLFLRYTANEGLTGAVERHQADGLPETGFRESYQRHAKALVQVGPVSAEARETPQGLDIELVALDNPFDPAIDTLRVRLIRFGNPAPDVQIAIFRKTAQGTEIEKLRTDAQGEADIMLMPGARHLLNAVIMERTKGGRTQWDSDWASLTFARP